LVEPLRGLIQVIISARIRAPDNLEMSDKIESHTCGERADHNRDFLIVHEIVVDRGLQEVGVLLQPS